MYLQVVKPFLEPKTYRKVNFVYSDDPSSTRIMEALFDMEELEVAFGGRNQACFNYTDYAARMREDDKKMPLFWAGAPADIPSLNISLDSDSDEEPDEKSPSTKCSGAADAS